MNVGVTKDLPFLGRSTDGGGVGPWVADQLLQASTILVGDGITHIVTFSKLVQRFKKSKVTHQQLIQYSSNHPLSYLLVIMLLAWF